MILLNLDQATYISGFSVYKDKELITYGSKDFTECGNLDARISEIKKWINQLANEYKAEVFAVEEIQFQKNFLTYKVLAQLFGVVTNNFYDQSLLYIPVESSKWKSYANVKGRKRDDQKKSAMEIVKNKFNIDATTDEADAILIGWYVVNKELPKIVNG